MLDELTNVNGMQMQWVFIIFTAIVLFVVLLLSQRKAPPLPVSDMKFEAMMQRINVLEKTVDLLQKENSSLRYEVARLRAENDMLYPHPAATARQESPETLIAEGKTKEAILTLLSAEEDEERADTYTLMLAKLSRIDGRLAKGIIQEEEYNRQIGSIESAVLNMNIRKKPPK